MGVREDLTGMKLGKLTAIKFHRFEYGNSYWYFQCECGNMISARKDNFKKGRTKSCGCLKRSLRKNENSIK